MCARLRRHDLRRCATLCIPHVGKQRCFQGWEAGACAKLWHHCPNLTQANQGNYKEHCMVSPACILLWKCMAWKWGMGMVLFYNAAFGIESEADKIVKRGLRIAGEKGGSGLEKAQGCVNPLRMLCQFVVGDFGVWNSFGILVVKACMLLKFSYALLKVFRFGMSSGIRCSIGSSVSWATPYIGCAVLGAQ